MDGAALAWPTQDRDADMTPPRGDSDREIGELATALTAHISSQKAAHDRLRAALEANEQKWTAVLETLTTLKTEFATWKENGPEAAKLKFTAGIAYSIVATALLMAGGVYTFYQAADAKSLANQTAIHDLAVKLDAKEKVEAAEQRLRDFKEATEAANVDRVEKLGQLNAAYITSLQRDQRK